MTAGKWMLAALGFAAAVLLWLFYVLYRFGQL